MLSIVEDAYIIRQVGLSVT